LSSAGSKYPGGLGAEPPCERLDPSICCRWAAEVMVLSEVHVALAILQE
jgi:hypothetical protein